ncbi:MAG TPA: hypothetical protein VHQ90_03205 [Thermoanaerobaculia bacterium]|nr:hypothetical protein [Thermoanaerobaculia bacterium]
MSLASPAAPPVAPRATPFKGLAYYERDDAARFAGRQRDMEAVANGILGNRTFVLYGRSGLGKTSLLLAGIFPRLEGLGHRTVAVRVLEDPLTELRRALAEKAEPGEADPRTDDLPVLIERAGRSADGKDRLVVVAFDQFEEFFVRFADQPDPSGGIRSGEELSREAREARLAQRQAFIREMGRLAAAPELNLRLVFSLREDWIAEMGDFAGAIPEINQHMYRLLPLTSFGVRQAIVETLRQSGAVFEAPLISALVDTLADFHFDPAVLQVLCSEVWEKARARGGEQDGPVRLALQDLTSLGGVRELFRGYLDQIQREIEPTDLRRRIQIRAVLDAMISEKNTKLAVAREFLLQQYFVITGEELDALLAGLYRHRLVRRDPRGNEVWFELVHERLIGVILPWLDTDIDFFNFRSARNLVVNSCRNPGWRDNPELLLNKGQLDGTVGPFKELLRFKEEERLFLVASAVYAHARGLEYWAELAGYETNAKLLDKFLDQKDNESVRRRAAEAAGRMEDRAGHFAERCLDLALHDRSARVRQAAARSFADLASPRNFQALAGRFGDRASHEAALDLLAEVIDKKRVPSRVKLGRRNLWRAGRKLYLRRLDRARKGLRERGRRGTLAGLVAALIWGATAGALLMWFIVYDIFPGTGVTTSWAWPVSVGAYLLLALLLGTWTGRSAARGAAKAALRSGREGLFSRALAGALKWPSILVVLSGLLYSCELISAGSLAQFVFVVAIPAVLFAVWSGAIAGWAKPAIWPGGGRRGPWIWAWPWAFGGSLLVPLLAWSCIPKEDLGLVEGVHTALLFLAASALAGGLVTYAGLVGMALSLPGDDSREKKDDAKHDNDPKDEDDPKQADDPEQEPVLGIVPAQPSPRARTAWRSLGALLAIAAIGLLAGSFGLSSLPFVSGSDLGTTPFSVDAKPGLGPTGTFHLKLAAPRTPGVAGLDGHLAPRAAAVFFPPEWTAYARGVGPFQQGSILLLQPGERRWLAFQWVAASRPGAIRIEPDGSLSGGLRSDPQLVVVRLAQKNGTWSGRLSGLQDLAKRTHPLYLRPSRVVQGGAWCEDAGLMLRVPGAGTFSPSSPDLRCQARPTALTFGYEALWNPIGADPELTLSAWIPEAVPDRETLIRGATLSPDGARVAILLAKPPSQPAVAMALPRGRSAAGFGRERRGEETVLLWSAADSDSKPLRHPARVDTAAFSDDGTRLLTSSQDGVWIWRIDVSDPSLLWQLAVKADAAVLSPDGTRVATNSRAQRKPDERTPSNDTRDEILRIWKVGGDPDKPIAELPHPAGMGSFAFSPDGTWIAGAGRDGSVRIWRADRPGVEEFLRADVKPGFGRSGLAFSRDGARLAAVCDGDRAVCVWNLRGSGKPVVLRHLGTVQGVAFSPDGSRVLMTDSEMAWLRKADGSDEPIPLRHPRGIRMAVFSGDGTRLTTAGTDGARVWNLDGSGEPAGEPIVLARQSVQAVALSRDGSRLLTVQTGGAAAAEVWDLAHPARPRDGGDVFIFLQASSKPQAEAEETKPGPRSLPGRRRQ